MTRTLVLNAGWLPINVVDAFDAVCDVFTGRAKCLDTRTFVTHDFESWVENWSDAIDEAKANSMRVVSTADEESPISLVLPEIVILAEYKGLGGRKVNHRRPKFSRTNIYRRDKNTCQYCGKKFKTEDLTMDHIQPKSKGGHADWLNIALACIPCNSKKDNKTPAQAGMKLIRQPFIPKAADLICSPAERLKNKIGSKPLRTWEQFIGKMYWEVELK